MRSGSPESDRRRGLGYTKRLGAWGVDAAIAATPFIVIAPILIYWAGRDSAADQLVGGALLALLPLPCFALYLGIQLLQLVRRSPTPGRRLFGLSIVMEGGTEIGIVAAMSRVMIGTFCPVAAVFVVQLPPLILLYPLVPLIDPLDRSLPEIVSKTRIESRV